MLGDTIAIMGEGQLLCKGSSMFLKKLYGAFLDKQVHPGYFLTVCASARAVLHSCPARPFSPFALWGATGWHARPHGASPCIPPLIYPLITDGSPASQRQEDPRWLGPH